MKTKLDMRAPLLVMIIVVVLVSGCTQSHNSTGINSVNITGLWSGIYRSKSGSGGWSCKIEKYDKGYRGFLSIGAIKDLPASVTLKGDKITIAVVGLIVFRGNVSGDKMCGTWTSQNGNKVYNGSWEGVRKKSLIPKNETAGKSPSEVLYESAIEVQPFGKSVIDVNGFIKPKLTEVFGGAKLIYFGTVSGRKISVNETIGLNYIVKRDITIEDVNALKTSIESDGYRELISLNYTDMFGFSFIKDDILPGFSITGDIGGQEIRVLG